MPADMLIRKRQIEVLMGTGKTDDMRVIGNFPFFVETGYRWDELAFGKIT